MIVGLGFADDAGEQAGPGIRHPGRGRPQLQEFGQAVELCVGNRLWIGGQGPTWEPENGTDYAAVDEGFVSITPLMIDLTDHELRPKLKDLERDGG